MEEPEERLARKEAFFKQLYSLDEEDGGPEDTCEAALILRSSRKLSSTAGSPLLPPPRQRFTRVIYSTPHFGRTVSAPLPNPITPLQEDVSVVQESPVPITRPLQAVASVQQSGSIGGNIKVTGKTMAKSTPRGKGKRKRGQSLELLPESQQIFRGLMFYFLPNNDIAPSRRFRIQKALDWGAVWVKDWRPGVTHIIVDRELKYKDVLSFLKLSAIPPDVVMVNEGYPSECMSFRYLVNPAQRQYQVEGYREAVAAEQSLHSVSSSIVSLPVKPGRVQPLQTPSRTDGSDEVAAAKQIDMISRELAEQQAPRGGKATSMVGPADALDEAIEEAKAVQDLPLDTDEEGGISNSMVADSSDEEVNEKGSMTSKIKKLSSDTWQDNFSCMQKHTGVDKDEASNARTIEILQKMADYYNNTNDHWRTTAYRRAIGALRKQKQRVTTKEEASAIPFIGERLAAKIEEIVWTNRLRRLDNTALEPNDEVLQTFLKIYGVGFSQATTWINQGFHTLDDLLSKAHLTKNQKIGIAHYSDFQSRIPRAEVELHGKVVRQAIEKVDKNIQIIIGGSYRRGAADSGDVDFIITKPDSSIDPVRTLILDTIIPRLFAANYLKCGLATSTSRGDGSKWHGAASLPGSTTWRRIDFLLVPWDEMGAALIYFTGNDIFNRSIRLLASKKGMRLNQRGLWRDVMRGRNRERVTRGSLVEGRSEKRIFEVLGVPWRPPEHRIC